ncbi:MAG TPA: DUF4249 domain-containing protein [Bacteroidales bacterium]|nr:DUF4249 domain-containing protein [Bacteroidales bacterium]
MKNLVSLFLLSILLISCNKDLSNIPDLGRKIVVNGLITTDNLLNIRIGRSTYINDFNELDDLDSAVVQFYRNDSRVDSIYHVPWYSFEIWNVFNSGNYRSKKVFPEPGKEYKVVVKAHNLPDASATVTIPFVVPVVKVDTSGIILPQGSYFNYNKGYLCKIEFDDPGDETNFYLFSVHEIFANPDEEYSSINHNLDFHCLDPIVEEKLFSGYRNEAVAFSDKLINGQKHIISVIIKKEDIGLYAPGNSQKVNFRLYSITEDFFQYIRNLNLYNKNLGSPFAEPVTVFSNIIDGYGFFTGASVSEVSIEFPLAR